MSIYLGKHMTKIEEKAKQIEKILIDSIELIHSYPITDYIFRMIKGNRKDILLFNSIGIEENEKFFWETKSNSLYLRYDSKTDNSGYHVNFYVKNDITNFSYTDKFYLFSKVFQKDEKNILLLLDNAIKELEEAFETIKVLKKIENGSSEKILKNATNLSKSLNKEEMLSILPEVSSSNRYIFAEVFFKIIPEEINLNEELDIIKNNWIKLFKEILREENRSEEVFSEDSHNYRLKYGEKIIKQMMDDPKLQNVLEKTNLYKKLNCDFSNEKSTKNTNKRKI